MSVRIRPVTKEDRNRVRDFIRDQWGDEIIIVHGIIYQPHKLKGFVATDDNKSIVGLATYNITNNECELVTLNSIHEGEGIGSLLLKTIINENLRAGCSRLWCITTNDNLPALGFFQKRGFRIIAIHPGAVERSRSLKPSLPLYGIDSIPILDEIELELRL